jgi:hypothetical protein
MLTYCAIVNIMASHNYQASVVSELTSKFGINIAEDLKFLGRLTPSLAQLDGNSNLISHVQDEYGADYFCSRVDYFNQLNQLQAYRVIAHISAGKRTKLAYWLKSGSYQKINVHRGHGYLIVGDPEDTEMISGLNSAIYSLSSDVTPIVLLPPGRFYTLQAASWSEEPFIVSALCQANTDGSWSSYEVRVEPGDETIETSDGIIEVPDDFLSGDFI